MDPYDSGLPQLVSTAIAHSPSRPRNPLFSVRKRKGLVKYALQHGYALTPIYSFGENESFVTFSGLLPLRLWFNRFQAVWR